MTGPATTMRANADFETASVVSLDQVSMVFDTGTAALQDFSLDLRKGEFVSLLGASGCGKSTVLRLIAGLAEPTDGQVLWEQSSSDTGEHPLGYVFQEPTLMPWSTVFSNVWLPLRLKGVSRSQAQDRVMESLELVGLQDHAKSRPNELSGGMKMRVSIARALVTRPGVLLLDEPFAALDEITRSKLNDDLLALWERFGWTILFVTHSVFEAVYLSSRVVVMSAGPGRIASDHAIPLEYPRTEALRLQSDYSHHCGLVSNELRRAMGQ